MYPPTQESPLLQNGLALEGCEILPMEAVAGIFLNRNVKLPGRLAH
tara:strand:+ start:1841 stop:1978 length:138 start_codon:yes stop_codon:yes gene_type:complete